MVFQEFACLQIEKIMLFQAGTVKICSYTTELKDIYFNPLFFYCLCKILDTEPLCSHISKRCLTIRTGY